MKNQYKAAAALAVLWAGSMAIADTADDIEALSTTFETAFNSGDAAGVAAHYTEDAVILPPDSPRIDGRDGVQKVWQAFIDAGAKDLDLVTTDVDDMGDTANEIGTFSLSVPNGNGGTTAVAGKYIVVWKKDDAGDWKLAWDIWNTSPAE